MIGVYGGTFNPVHYGHLRTALEMKQRLRLAQMLMLPCHSPPHRPEPDVPPAQRVRMLELALEGTPELSLDRRELERPGPSYMVDTLASLGRERPATSLILIIGADAFNGLETWREWRKLFDHAHVAVMTRPGHKPEALTEFLQARLCGVEQLAEKPAGGLCMLEVTPLGISATQIRRLIAAGENPKFLLPDAVINYINQHQLYRTA